MKTIQIILFATIGFATGFCNPSHAQDSIAQTKKIIERSIKGQTYVYVYNTESSGTIHNKKNYIDTIQEPYCGYYSAKLIEPVDDIFDKIFSAERKKELKGNYINMIYFCDSVGNILEIKLILSDLSMITPEEVFALENALLKYKLEIRGTCPDKKYYRLALLYRGWLDEPKKK